MLILVTYLVVFVVAYAILVTSVVKFERADDGGEPFSFNYEFVDNARKIFNETDKIFPGTLFKNLIWSYKPSKNGFNCSVLGQIKNFYYLTSGWTKSVFSFRHDNKEFALKTVNMNGKDMKNCLQSRSMRSCYKKASSKMYKEYILSNELSHSNIIKVSHLTHKDEHELQFISFALGLGMVRRRR